MLGEYGNDQLRRAHEKGLLHASTGNLRTAYETGRTYFQDVYNTQSDQLEEHMSHVTATAMVPLNTSRGMRGIVGLAKFGRSGWPATERTIIETVGRSLALALDRAEKVAELAQERASLMVANDELESFAYSVSHDLRTPVRHITGFSNLLRGSLEGKLDAKASRYLDVVDQAAGRMNSLIDAMLELSRTSRQPLRLGWVDLGALVASVRMELEMGDQERQTIWQTGNLPLVSGDQDLLRQVLLNLLSNALKYARDRNPAVIEVWAQEHPEEWAVFVRDNGVGFDPRYQGKLFGVFQRLHRAEEFEGTGVGLSTVRRIVLRHGGRVSATGVPGSGATFGFTLPRKV
ncbi:sensor histidine kinase [Deinococcus peraridilitoris]|uniref:sensor histidine kinase n=1 Tax=Deinococcus peraridilitoris TaxID=432329 RepID=UPI000694E42C|nr:ATP-binding protein [Deinococcus peraridilitoris]